MKLRRLFAVSSTIALCDLLPWCFDMKNDTDIYRRSFVLIAASATIATP